MFLSWKPNFTKTNFYIFLYWTDFHLTPVTCDMFDCYRNRLEQHFPSQFMGLIHISLKKVYCYYAYLRTYLYHMGVLTLMACTSFRRCSWYERSRFLIVSRSSSISVHDWESATRSRIYSRCQSQPARFKLDRYLAWKVMVLKKLPLLMKILWSIYNSWMTGINTKQVLEGSMTF